MVLIGGPDDGVITPWQSSHFGYFDEQEDVIPVYERPVFDAIGLKALNDSGRLAFVTLPGVHHYGWHLNIKVIQDAIIPYLD